jgi:hypothetical protein
MCTESSNPKIGYYISGQSRFSRALRLIGRGVVRALRGFEIREEGGEKKEVLFLISLSRRSYRLMVASYLQKDRRTDSSLVDPALASGSSPSQVSAATASAARSAAAAPPDLMDIDSPGNEEDGGSGNEALTETQLQELVESFNAVALEDADDAVADIDTLLPTVTASQQYNRFEFDDRPRRALVIDTRPCGEHYLCLSSINF